MTGKHTAEVYARVVRYSVADAWDLFKKRLQAEPHLRWGGHPEAAEIRPIAADAYVDATGDEDGGQLLRDHKQHVVIGDDGKVRRGRWTLRHVNAALRDAVGHMENVGDDYTPGDFEVVENQTPDSDGTAIVRHDIHLADEYGGYFGEHPHHEVGGVLADILRTRVAGDHADRLFHWSGDVAGRLPRDTRMRLAGQNRKRFLQLLDGLRNAPVDEVVPDGGR